LKQCCTYTIPIPSLFLIPNTPPRFIAGVGLGLPATSFPLAVLTGLGAGALVGYLIYKGGNKTSLQIFLVVSTCFLYLVAAGLFSKGVWNLEQDAWVRLAGEGAAEAGAGPGSYDIRKSVWHVNVSLCGCEIKDGVLISGASAARHSRMVMGAGEFSIRCLDGRIVRRTVLSFRTTCTGSLSLLASCIWAGRRTRRPSLRTMRSVRRLVGTKTLRGRRRAGRVLWWERLSGR
jgi:hypothetical protein